MARKKTKPDGGGAATALEEPATSTKKTPGGKPAAGGDAPATEARQPGPPKSVWREYFESAVHVGIMFVFFITFIGRTVGVPTGSMQNTIYIGDHFLINKFVFAPGSHPFFLPQRDVRRGDIIVFKYPGDRYNPGLDEMYKVTPYRDYYIKRVIGMPGETIQVRGPNVYINDKVLPEHRITTRPGVNEKAALEVLNVPARSGEPYTVYYSEKTIASSPDRPEKPPEIFHFAVEKPYTIPDGHYFVMGDARDNSADSRAWGPVAADLVVGRALFVFWSNDESMPLSNPVTNFLKNTRWWRTGTMIK